MKYYLLLISWMVSLGRTKNVVPLTIDDHYWRDFNGVFPSDAIIGAVNDKVNKVYIVQMALWHNEDWDFLPTGISKDDTTAHSSYFNSVASVSDEARIKVMCTSNPRRYHWYSNTASIPPGCRYVIAGRESDSPLYVARAITDQDAIGKYFADYRFTELIAAVDNRELFYRDYETLTYCV